MLNAIAEGPGSEHFKYHWEKMNDSFLSNTVSGQGTPNLVITSVTLFDGGMYYCNVMNQWGTTCRSNIGLVKVLGKCILLVYCTYSYVTGFEKTHLSRTQQLDTLFSITR